MTTVWKTDNDLPLDSDQRLKDKDKRCVGNSRPSSHRNVAALQWVGRHPSALKNKEDPTLMTGTGSQGPPCAFIKDEIRGKGFDHELDPEEMSRGMPPVSEEA